MAKKSTGYLGFSYLISVIFAIIPFTNIVFGVITRLQRNNLIGVVLNIILCPVFYVIDLVTMILSKRIWVLA